MMWRGIVVLLGIALLISTGTDAASKAENNFVSLSLEILQNLQKFWPVQATAKGVHTYDDRFPDYSAKSVESERKLLRQFLARLYKYKSVRLPDDMHIDRRLLSNNCEIAMLRLVEFPYHTLNPNLYLDDAADGIYLIMIQDYADFERRAANVIKRMQALPGFLKQAEANLKSPPPIWLDYARENAENVISLYREISRTLIDSLPGRADEIYRAADLAVGALEGYKNFLDRLTPGESGSFALGADYYNYLLEHRYMLNFDADSLLRIGEKLFAESMAAYTDYEEKMAAEGRLTARPVYVPASLSRSDIIGYYNWEIEAVKQFVIDHDLVTVPEDVGPCLAVETPKFLQGVIGSIAYQPPGAFDAATTGYFYVRPIPDSLTAKQREDYYRRIYDRRFRGSVVHEAYPGHHLQLQLAARNQSDIRKWQDNLDLIEGWALYCEEMAYDAGLYDDAPQRYLGVLGGIAFRSARIILDVKLHTGQFSYDEAVNWLCAEMDIADTNFVRREVLRYTLDPGQPMSYMIGKLAIMDLRDTLKGRQGEGFDLKSFHDRLLAEGSIPVALIREKLLK